MIMKERYEIEEGYKVHYFGEVKSLRLKQWFSECDGTYSQKHTDYIEGIFYYSAEVTIEGYQFIFGSWQKNNATRPTDMRELSTSIMAKGTTGPSSPCILLAMFNKSYNKYRKETGKDLEYLVNQNIKEFSHIIIKKQKIEPCVISLLI